jgi:hypothetical protein
MRILIAALAICAACPALAEPDDIPALGMRVEAKKERRCVETRETQDKSIVDCKTVVTHMRIAAIACRGPAHRAGIMVGDVVDSIGIIDIEDGVPMEEYTKFIAGAGAMEALRFRLTRKGVALFEAAQDKRLFPDAKFKSTDYTCALGHDGI